MLVPVLSLRRFGEPWFDAAMTEPLLYSGIFDDDGVSVSLVLDGLLKYFAMLNVSAKPSASPSKPIQV